jgi:threonine aldolase
VLAAALGVDPETVDTNIVFAEVADPAAFVAEAAARGVRLMQLGRTKVRVVTHLDVTREDAERAAEVLATIAR